MNNSKLISMKNLPFLLLILFAKLSIAQSSFKFSVDDKDYYTFENISEFIDNEIRERFSRGTSETFHISVIGEKSNGNLDTVIITMESRFLYLIEFNGIAIASNVSRYTNEDIILNMASIQTSFDNATRFKELSLKERQNTLKVFAFLLAETARFEDVANAVNNIYQYNCSFNWEEYKLLLRRWKTISIFVNSIGAVDKNAEFGGSRAILIVPITEKNVLSYDNKVKNGWRVVRKYGSQIKDKPVNIPDENRCITE